MAITKPTVNGSVGTWGTELNTALDDLQAQVVAAQQTATSTGSNVTTLTGRVTTVENSVTALQTGGGFYKGTAAQRSSNTNYANGGTYYETDTGRYWVGTSSRWVPSPGSILLKARQTAAQVIADGTDVTVWWTGSYGTVDYDRLGGTMGGGTNGPNYTPGIPGWYQFSGGASFTANANGLRTVSWYVNGSASGGCSANYQNAGGTISICPARTFTVLLGSSDYVSMVVRQTSGSALTTASAASLSGQPSMVVTYLGPA